MVDKNDKNQAFIDSLKHIMSEKILIKKTCDLSSRVPCRFIYRPIKGCSKQSCYEVLYSIQKYLQSDSYSFDEE